MVQASEMQRFVSMIADAAHAAGRKVTVGSASLKWSSHAQEAQASYWDDASLRKSLPGSPNGTLDFYNVHYYDWMYPLHPSGTLCGACTPSAHPAPAPFVRLPA